MRSTAGRLMLLALLFPVVLIAATRHTPARVPTRAELQQIIEAKKAPLQSLVTAEQEFAKLSGRKGIRAAFLASLSLDCVMFRPLPVNGYDAYESRPATTAKLAWAPAYAEVSAAGDFGMTTGPWEFTPPAERDGAETAYGDFLSVWRREPGKPWENALDIGVSHDPPAVGLRATPAVEGPAHEPLPPATEAEPTLLALDQSMSQMAQEFNAARSILAWTSSDLRDLNEGEHPREGDSARNAMIFAARTGTWNPLGSALASSRDMGYTYGVLVSPKGDPAQAPDSVVYVHVWRRLSGDTWKIFAAVDNPLKR